MRIVPIATLAMMAFVSLTDASGILFAQEGGAYHRTPSRENSQIGISFCGPRAVYYFARSASIDCELSEVTTLCGADESGICSLEGVVRACEQLGLQPVAVQCTFEQFSNSRGPAIVVFPGPQHHVMHFVGFLERDGESYLSFDPARSTGRVSYSSDLVREAFQGVVVYLHGSSPPPLRSWWFPQGYSYLIVGCIAGVLFILPRVRFKRSRACITAAKPS